MNNGAEKLKKRLLFWKIIMTSIGFAGSVLGIRLLFMSAVSVLQVPFDFVGTTKSLHEEAMINSIALGLLILLPSLIFMVCSLWFGMGVNRYLWSFGRHPLVFAILLFIGGAIIIYFIPRLTNIGLAVMGGGALGTMITTFFLQVDRSLFNKKGSDPI